MIYTGTIKSVAGLPVTGALLEFRTDAGARITSVPVSMAGTWTVDDSFDDGLFTPGVVAVFSAPGYYEYKISSTSMDPVFNVTLTPKTNKALLIGAGAAAGLLALTLTKKKGRRSGILGAAETESKRAGLPSWLLPTLVLGGGAYVLWNLFGKPDPRIQQGQALADAAARELLTAGAPTLTDAQLEALASSIVQAANDCGTDVPAINSAFNALHNRADLLSLIKIYGVRIYHACFDGDWFKDTPRNLAETLTSELSRGDLDEINSGLAAKGINFSF